MLDRRFDHVVAVARCGSFTKAAERVGMSQSGMTKSIADLERELGYPLFFRTRRGAMPTEQGRRFVEHASRLLADARTLLSGQDTDGRMDTQLLRIGVCPASLQWLLTSPLAQLVSDYSAIRIDVVAATFNTTVQLIESGALDLALGFEDDFAEWGELRRERIGVMHPVLFVRKDHPILDGRAIDSVELSRWIFVVPSESRPYGGPIRALFADKGKWQHHVHVVDHFPLIRRLVAASNAIGVTTRKFAASDTFKVSYQSLPGENPLPSATICYASRARWEPNIAVRTFLRLLREHIPEEVGA